MTSAAASTHHIWCTALQIASTCGDVGIGTENYPGMDKADTRGPQWTPVITVSMNVGSIDKSVIKWAELK